MRGGGQQRADMRLERRAAGGERALQPAHCGVHLAGREQGKAGPLDDLATIDGAAQRLERWLEAPLEDRA